MHARRRFAFALAALVAAALPAAPAWSQAAYPAKPVRVIVPFPPGQAADIFARMLADRLSAAWGQQVVVENRGGGGVLGVMAGKAGPVGTRPPRQRGDRVQASGDLA